MIPRWRLCLCAAVLLTAQIASGQDPGAPVVSGARLVPVPFEALGGWPEDDHPAALAAFRKSCRAFAVPQAASDPRLPAALQGVCSRVLADDLGTQGAARRFFERHFQPFRVESEQGFLTGYFEPEIEGSTQRRARLSMPLLARPADLVSLEPGTISTLDPVLTAARRNQAGLEPFPDRAAIEDGALGESAKALVFVDPIDAFVAHVQGSVRVRLDDGTSVRLAFAGKNGQPYTSIGRVLVNELGVAPADMTMDRVVAWLRTNPADASRVMRQNRSYIFFRRADELDVNDGPLGAAGVQLTAGRSIAIDRSVWPYGLPFVLEAQAAEPGVPNLKLAVAIGQDTGTAIVGAARVDLFVGSGADAGLRAGRLRQAVRLTVLWPRPSAAAGDR